MRNKDQILLENLYYILYEGKKETIDYLQKNGADQDTITLFTKQDATGKPLFATDQAIIMFNWLKDNQVKLEDIEKDYSNFKKYFPNKNLRDFKNYIDFSEQVHAKVGEKEFENRNKDIDRVDVHGDDKENVIADDEDVLILKGDNEHNCVKYGKGYSFCISRPYGGNMYGNYRLAKSSTFYFIYFKKVPKENPKHIMVLDRTNNGWEWTFGENQTKVIEGGWDEVIKQYPILAKYKDKFVNNPLTNDEIRYQNKLSKFVRLPDKNKFENFSYKEKADVLKFGMEIPEDIFDSLDKFLRNEYISVGPSISKNIFNKLNDNEKERYIKVRKIIIIQNDVKNFVDREIVKNDQELFEKFAKEDIAYYKKLLETYNKQIINGVYGEDIYYFSNYLPFILNDLVASSKIEAVNIDEVILPKLESAYDIILTAATKVDLRNLVLCGELSLPKMEEINFPKLEHFLIGDFSDAKTVNLPNLKECNRINCYNSKQINLPKLEKCKNSIMVDAKIVNLPNLKECGEIEGLTGVEELYVPNLESCESIVGMYNLKKIVIPKNMIDYIPYYINNKHQLKIEHPHKKKVNVESFKNYFNR